MDDTSNTKDLRQEMQDMRVEGPGAESPFWKAVLGQRIKIMATIEGTGQ